MGCRLSGVAPPPYRGGQDSGRGKAQLVGLARHGDDVRGNCPCGPAVDIYIGGAFEGGGTKLWSDKDIHAPRVKVPSFRKNTAWCGVITDRVGTLKTAVPSNCRIGDRH